MNVKIVTDSTSYIPAELRKRYDITVVSLQVTFENESIREVDMNSKDFYARMSRSSTLPKSSLPITTEMYEAFEKNVSKNNAVVGIFLSSDMSGTYSSSHLIKDMILQHYPEAQIQLLDSKSNCMQTGFAVIEAAKAAHEGKSIEEVMAAASSVMKTSRFLFVPHTLEYLKKGGRIGSASALLGTILQIKPILTVVDGKTAVFDKVRTKKKAIEKIVETAVEDIGKSKLGGIIVHHIDAEEEGNELAYTLEKLLGVSVKSWPIGPVIGLHVGPGTVGLVYYTTN